MRYLIPLLALCACADPTAPVVPASVQIVAVAYTNPTVTLTLKNAGGDGAFYVEFRGFSNVPNQNSGQTSKTDPVDVLPKYQETLRYTVSAFQVAVVHVYTRSKNSAAYTRTGCYQITTQTHC